MCRERVPLRVRKPYRLDRIEYIVAAPAKRAAADRAAGSGDIAAAASGVHMNRKAGRSTPFVLRVAALAAMAVLGACAGQSDVSTGGMPEQLARCKAGSAAIYQASGFDDYVGRVRSTARNCGIRSATLDLAFRGIERRAELDGEPRMPASLNPQLAALPHGDYRRAGEPNPTRRYVEERIAQLSERGRGLLAQHRSLLKRVEARWGVPAEYIVAYWGIETAFGGFTGNHDVIETLANLGHGSNRRRFFTEELLGALIILDRGLVNRATFKGSYAGAFGHAQFMPTSYILNAVDFDGDGRADLYGSLPDVFASIANYNIQRGRWDPAAGKAIFEVRLPRSFPFEEADIDNRKDTGFWTSQRVTLANGEQLAALPGQSAILLPAGCNGPAFMVTQNFYAIMDYNPLVDYAMAVSMLAETLRDGEIRLSQPWPEEDTLSRAERVRLQEMLVRRGYGDLKVDGVHGRDTRAAIRRAQAATRARCVDGYATASLLQSLGDPEPRYATVRTPPRAAPAKATPRGGLISPAFANTPRRRR